MKIVCSDNMPYAREAFSRIGDPVVFEGRRITAEDVKDAEILAIRSTTKVDRRLLEGSRVRFVGTATIGTDHMDIPYLEANGIKWCYAPGCNASSVSEYMTAALLYLAERYGLKLSGLTLGVIGVGNVGSLVVKKAEVLGMGVIQNDPPKRDLTGDDLFRPLDELLTQSDIVTVHVPLTREGPYPTFHLANRDFFSKLNPGAIFINAARGEVMETEALLQAMGSGQVSHAVIDTWEEEPVFHVPLLDAADIGTPHIAGHSFEGKVCGTVMVYREACRFLGVPATWLPEGILPEPIVPEVSVDASSHRDELVLREVVKQVYDIERDDADLRAGWNGDEEARSAHFDRLRRDYPVRREFRFTRVKVLNGSSRLIERFSRLGFQTEVTL